MGDSFFIVPSVASPSMKKLQAENATLKAELQMTKTRLSNAEQVIRSRQQQEKQLRDTILMVRREVCLTAERPVILVSLIHSLASPMHSGSTRDLELHFRLSETISAEP